MRPGEVHVAKLVNLSNLEIFWKLSEEANEAKIVLNIGHRKCEPADRSLETTKNPPAVKLFRETRVALMKSFSPPV